MKKYTIYETTNLINNMIYVGCHITNNINDNYLGSGTNIKKDIKKYGKENFIKKILHVFNNEKDMSEKEKEIVNNEFIKRNDTYNIIIGGGFLTTNCVVVKDINGYVFMTHITNPLYLSGELISCNTGLITVRDIIGNVYSVYKNDQRYISGELYSINKNTKLVIDKTGKKIRVNMNHIGIINGDLKLVKNELIKKKNSKKKNRKKKKKNKIY